MKLAGTALLAVATIAVTASPALAGKKAQKAHGAKGKKAQKAAKAEAPTEAQRSISDQLGIGFVDVARPGAAPAEPAVALDDAVVEERAADAMARAQAFDLTRERLSAAPSGDAAPVIELKTLTETEVNDTIRAHAGELQYCWARVPAAQRDAMTVALAFTIRAEGDVASVSILGDAPAKFAACARTVASRWQFPHADTTTEVEYPMVFSTVK
ncbi:MAG: AgmX/PglI C-terminal domain-containing protein [Myxococcales bacterium]|nr:AgmX/PglI C-terminal domain-containing protein [Myxococcales bacterium]